jgi:hypothetical protein
MYLPMPALTSFSRSMRSRGHFVPSSRRTSELKYGTSSHCSQISLLELHQSFEPRSRRQSNFGWTMESASMILPLAWFVSLQSPDPSLLSYISQDEQIHFARPIIASTAKSFYFDKWHRIANHDQDTFRESVPKLLVAPIGTVVGPLCYIAPDFY